MNVYLLNEKMQNGLFLGHSGYIKEKNFHYLTKSL